LGACGQRGPLYYPVLPPVNSADTVMPQNLPKLQNLPAPQTRLMNGAPMTNLAEPPVSLPEAGESTMPAPNQALPANTPAAGSSNGSALTPSTVPQPRDPSSVPASAGGAAPSNSATPP